MSDFVSFSVADLDGRALDWALGKAIGREVEVSWSTVGPIVDAKRIALVVDRYTTSDDGVFHEIFVAGVCKSLCWHTNAVDFEPSTVQEGPSALIALSRSIVATEFGDSIDVPQTLASDLPNLFQISST